MSVGVLKGLLCQYETLKVYCVNKIPEGLICQQETRKVINVYSRLKTYFMSIGDLKDLLKGLLYQ